jgi:hypothetical protein
MQARRLAPFWEQKDQDQDGREVLKLLSTSTATSQRLLLLT